MRHGKKYRSISEKIDRSQSYSPEEAFKLIKEGKIAKFDESVEAHVRLGIDTKKGEQQVRGAVVLPHGVGKRKKNRRYHLNQIQRGEKRWSGYCGRRRTY